uniref:NADH-ubiquinone oxidoreductase chain 4 n=1 Tax=Anisolabididae sp. NS-2016 TaxID=1914569 RepID=A0A1J0M496_9NEOP|nr:NADH dehydrogenase subunit 4 [Anisolabididae sp. NS-2016]
MFKLIMVIFSLLFIIKKDKSWWVVISWLSIIIFFMLFYSPIYNLFMNLSMNLSLDILSFSMTILSVWIILLMVLASSMIYKMSNFYKYFLSLNLLLLLFLIMTFSTMSMLMFYISFEASLIPTLLLILGWGYQPERLQAGMYLMIYTLLASLPLLVSIFFLYNLINSMNMWMLWSIFELKSMFLYFGLSLAFLVKSPMFLVHLWLPKAHVEAPVSGSMILAGILLKLGGYGLMRLLKSMITLNLKFNFLWITISLIGGVVVSLLCLRQSDLKMLVAYSSVAHMSLGIIGILTMTYWGMLGSLILMIGHGLCSSCLFSLVNIIYERSGSRSLYLNQGFLNIMPSMAMWWFLFSACNMAAPPSLNLLGEVSLLISIMNWSKLSLLMLMMTSFFSATYCYYMYSYSQHGKLYSGLYSCSSGEFREYLLMMLHWLPLNLMILKSEWFMMTL